MNDLKSTSQKPNAQSNEDRNDSNSNSLSEDKWAEFLDEAFPDHAIEPAVDALPSPVSIDTPEPSSQESSFLTTPILDILDSLIASEPSSVFDDIEINGAADVHAIESSSQATDDKETPGTSAFELPGGDTDSDGSDLLQFWSKQVMSGTTETDGIDTTEEVPFNKTDETIPADIPRGEDPNSAVSDLLQFWELPDNPETTEKSGLGSTEQGTFNKTIETVSIDLPTVDGTDSADPDLEHFPSFQFKSETTEESGLLATDDATSEERAETIQEDAQATGIQESLLPPLPVFPSAPGSAIDTPAPPAGITPEWAEYRTGMPLSDDTANHNRTFFRTKTVLYSAFVLLCLIATGYYYLLHDKTESSSGSKKAVSPAPPQSASITKMLPAQPSVTAAVPPDGQPGGASARAPARTDALPTFIPATGRDVSFSSKEPGWERYVDTRCEYRLYRREGRITTIQILATKGEPISRDSLGIILKELTATADYTTLPMKEEQAGFIITQGSAGNKADFLVYRKNGAIRGLVIMLK